MPTITKNKYYKQLDTLNAMERELYRILRIFSNNKTKECYPSITTLAKLFKSCRNTTKKYLRLLEEKNFIHIQERKVKHKVTDNKFNETHIYTLLLDKFKTTIKKKDKSEKNKQDNKVLELKETDLDVVLKELSVLHNKEVVTSALKTMRKNMRNGSIITNMKRYLETLINKADSQLEEVNKAIIGSTKTSNVESYTNHQVSNKKPNKNHYRTKFHNFEQRTSKYTREQLNEIIINKNNKK